MKYRDPENHLATQQSIWFQHLRHYTLFSKSWTQSSTRASHDQGIPPSDQYYCVSMVCPRIRHHYMIWKVCTYIHGCIWSFCQVLQRPVDRDLELYSEGKEKGSPLAKVTMVSLSSQPVDTDEPGDRTKSFMADNPGKWRETVILFKILYKGTELHQLFSFMNSWIHYKIITNNKHIAKHVSGPHQHRQGKAV